MTPRERLFRFLAGQETDRPPVWMLFPYAPTSYYVDVWNHPGYRRVVEATLGNSVILNRRSLEGVPLFTPEVEITREVTQHTDITRYRYRGMELSKGHRQTANGLERKQLLVHDEDLEAYVQFPILTDPALIKVHMDEWLKNYLEERKAFPKKYGSMMLDFGEPICAIYHASCLESYSMWSITHHDVIKGCLENMMQRLRVIYAYALERKLADIYFFVGSELASPPMASRTTFQSWVVPYAKELVRMIHAAGSRAIQHYHGQVGLILRDFLEIGADALHTIEEPPIGNITLEDAFSVVEDKMGLIGCIQYDCFRSYTPTEMRQEVREQRRRTSGQRFMFSPSAGPFDPEPSSRLIDNYLAFHHEATNPSPGKKGKRVTH